MVRTTPDLSNDTSPCSSVPRETLARPFAGEEKCQEALDDRRATPGLPLPQPCGRYAEGYSAGKDKALTEFLASLNGPPHSEDCGWLPSQMKRACHRNDMTLMARSSPGIFELFEA